VKIDRKVIGSLVLGFALIGVLFYFADLGEMLAIIGDLSPIWIVAATLLYTVNWLIRGVRWKIILAEMDYGLTLLESTALTLLGNLANLFIPAKMGDLARVVALKRKVKTPITKGLVSVGVDRFSDFVGVLVLAILSFILLPQTLNMPEWVTQLIVSAVAVSAVAGAVILFVAKTRVRDFVKHHKRIHSMAEGLASISHKRVLAEILALSIVLWFLEAVIAYMVFLSTGHKASIVVVVFAIMVANLTKTLPVTPGAIGVYEGVMAGIFVAAGLPYELGLFVSIADHAIKNAFTLAAGALSTSYVGVSISDVGEDADEAGGVAS